jgi:hypothetical protein
MVNSRYGNDMFKKVVKTTFVNPSGKKTIH